MSQVSLSVKGHKPVPWACNEWDWRKALAEESRRVKVENCVQAPETARFAVQVAFRMNAVHIERVDLDNLAKPVLDTLFKVRRPQINDLLLTGALFDVDDDRVFKLVLEKVPVLDDRDEGVQVTVVWE